jgi:hypothetical protein
MSESLKAVKDKDAFLKMYKNMGLTPFGKLTDTALELLVSKGGMISYAQLLGRLEALCGEYPMDVAALASLQFAGHALSGYLLFLDSNRTGTGSAESGLLPLDATIAGRTVVGALLQT